MAFDAIGHWSSNEATNMRVVAQIGKELSHFDCFGIWPITAAARRDFLGSLRERAKSILYVVEQLSKEWKIDG